MSETIATIDEVLQGLTARYQALRDDAAIRQREADYIEAEIRGMKRARSLLQSAQASDGVEPPKQRRPRRPIKNLVRAHCEERGYPSTESEIEASAAEIGIKPSEMRKALAKDGRLEMRAES